MIKPIKYQIKSSFSLIELLVVITILGILATVVTVNVMDHLASARVTQAQIQMNQFMESLQFYYLKNYNYPTSSEGLKKLTEKTPEKPNGYIDAIPLDPWGKPYEYRCPTEHKFDIISFGRDGQDGGDGEDMDVKSWEIIKTEGN